MIKKVAFIGYPTRDIEASRRFYGEVLGLQHDHTTENDRWSEYATPEGVTVALDTYGPELTDAPVPYISFECDDLEAAVARVQEQGGKVVKPAQANRDAEGREICSTAIILDPDGNVIMLHRRAAWRDAAPDDQAQA